MLVAAYGEHTVGKTQCFEWFKKFKSGNFDVRNEDCEKPPKKIEDWDQKGVICYQVLKPGKTVNTNRYQQQMIDLNRALQEKRPDYRKRQHKVIFLHDNAPSSDYHLFASLHGEKFGESARPTRRTDLLSTRRAARPLFG